MKTDLETMSKAELEDLKRKVENTLKKKESDRINECYASMLAIADEYGYSFDEIIAVHKPSKRKTPPKYRNPEDASQTWSGLGRQPAWIKELIAAGRDLEEVKIAA